MNKISLLYRTLQKKSGKNKCGCCHGKTGWI